MRLRKRISAFLLSAVLVIGTVASPAEAVTVQAADQSVTGTKSDSLSGLYTSAATTIAKGTTYVVTMNASGKKVDDSTEYNGYIGKGFRFTTGNNNCFYEIYGVNASVPNDIICNIYNSSFQNIGDNLGGENSIPTSGSFKSIVRLAPNSTYYIVFATENDEELKTNSSSKGRLTINEIADDHQDTKDKATAISAGQQYTCKADAPGDTDFFKLTTSSEKSYYTFDIENKNIRNAISVTIYDSKNNIIAEESVDRGKTYSETLNLNTMSDYYISVASGEEDSDVYSTEYTGNYQLQVTAQADDYPDTVSSAESIEILKKYNGMIQHDSDHDVVRMNSGDLARLDLAFENKSATEDLEYTVSSRYGVVTSGSVSPRESKIEPLDSESIAKNSDYYIDFSGTIGVNYTFAVNPVSHGITYELDGGTNSIDNLPYYYETESRKLGEPTRTGYAFEGWYITKDHIMTIPEDDDRYDYENEENNIISSKITHVGNDTKDITLYANWEIRSYTVTFENNGETVETQTIRHGEAATAPEISNPGYSLSWDTEFDCITGDLTVSSVWTPNNYSIHFDANGGEGTMPDRNTIYGREITLTKNRFKKEGHHFTGWKTEGAEEIIEDGATISNLTTGEETVLYAQWEKDIFVVTFMDNGKVVETQNVAWKEDAIQPSVSKTGYTAYCIESIKNVTSDRVVNITWEPNTYTIRYNSNNGTGSMRGQTAIYDQDITLINNTFTRTGFDFAGWSTDKNGAAEYADGDTVHNITGDNSVTLYAQWKKHVYTVEFKDGDKTVKTEKVLYLDPAEAPILNKAGYILAWDQAFDEIRDEMVINAVWVPVAYNINYDANGGVGVMNNDTAVYDNFQKLSACQFTRAGHDFIGWSLTPYSGVVYKDSSMVISLTSSDSITLYAQWKKQVYRVEFISDGVVTGAADVEYGGAVMPPAISKTGYTLSWDRDLSCITAGGTINAVWTLNEYTIVFNANGGKGKMAARVVTPGQIFKLPNKFKKTNYKFTGWKINNQGELIEPGDEVTNLSQGGTVVLYAQWKADTSKPGQVKISSVKRAKNGKVTIKFKKASKAQKYVILCSENKKLKKAKKITTTKTSAKIKLTKDKTWYIAVKSVKNIAGKTIYGKTSKIRILK